MVAPYSPQPSITEAQANALLRAISRMTEAQSMSDAKLSQAALQVYCQYAHLMKGDDMIIDELMRRFDRLAGVKRDGETGEIVP